jgi:hypothetical protein
MSGRARTVIAVVALSSLSAACAAILGFERLEEDAPLTPDDAAAVDAPVAQDGGSDAPQNGACGVVGVPDPPPAQPVGDASDIEQEFAIGSVDFGLDTVAEPVGLNIDRRCTTSLATSSCKLPSPDQISRAIDYDGGVDNSGFNLVQQLALLGEAFSPTNINERLQVGEYGFVVRVRNYNGTPNDDSIGVEVYPALRHGVPPSVPDGGRSDLWVRDESYNFANSSTIRSSLAYVTAGVVVAFFETFEMPLSAPEQTPVERRMVVKLRDVWMRAQLVKLPDGNDGARGVLAGRWSTLDFLRQVRSLDVPNFGTICKQPLVYGQAKNTLCPGRDVRGRGVDDDKDLPCDAVSAGLAFTAYAVDKTTSAAPPVIPDPCVEAGIADDDNCP